MLQDAAFAFLTGTPLSMNGVDVNLVVSMPDDSIDINDLCGEIQTLG